MATLFQPCRSQDEKRLSQHSDHLAANSQSSPTSSPETGPFSGARSFQKPTRHSSLFLSGNSLACINRCPRCSFFTSGVRDTQREAPQRRLRPGSGTCLWPWHPSYHRPSARPSTVGHLFTDNKVDAGEVRASRAPKQ